MFFKLFADDVSDKRVSLCSGSLYMLFERIIQRFSIADKSEDAGASLFGEYNKEFFHLTNELILGTCDILHHPAGTVRCLADETRFDKQHCH